MVAQLHGARFLLVDPRRVPHVYVELARPGRPQYFAERVPAGLRLALLWFGSWKNGTSRYAADWVKVDGARFPRVVNAEGRTLEILTPLVAKMIDARET